MKKYIIPSILLVVAIVGWFVAVVNIRRAHVATSRADKLTAGILVYEAGRRVRLAKASGDAVAVKDEEYRFKTASSFYGSAILLDDSKLSQMSDQDASLFLDLALYRPWVEVAKQEFQGYDKMSPQDKLRLVFNLAATHLGQNLELLDFMEKMFLLELGGTLVFGPDYREIDNFLTTLDKFKPIISKFF